MKVRHEHIHAAISGVLVGEIDHGFVCADEVSERWLFIRANTGKNCLHVIYPYIISHFVIIFKHKRQLRRGRIC